jgi:protocadherin Fat 4
LDSRNGQFTLKKHLDYEIDPKQYTITCEASDGTYKSDKIKVIFNLINLPDNAPIFDHASYKIEVYENASLNKILCVSATDADSFNFSEENDQKLFKLSYYFDSDTQKPQYTRENFEIDSKSGCISIKTELDRETKSLYEMVVIADDGTFKASANVQIKVLDVNDNYPLFDRNTPSILKIAENSPIDTIVYAFKALDLDEAPNNYVQFEILYEAKYNSQTFPFAIGPIDGLLKITGLIDKEVTDSFHLTVRANDYGLKSSEVEILIEIIDMIDNAPQFEQTEFQVNIYENASIDDNVIKLRATDLDETDKIHYKIISGDLFGHFKINDDYIVVAMQLDFEQIQQFDLKVNAIDKGGNLDTANVKINVINVIDEAPYFFNSPYNINWCENEIGVIGQFEAILEKSETNYYNSNSHNNRVNYLLINNYEQYFSLNSTNAVLSVIKPIDHESLNGKPEIELRIIAIDSRSPRLTGEGVIYLTIYDVNDNEPYFSQSEYKITLTENQMYDTSKPIGTVIALDNDMNDQIEYQINGDSEAIEKFTVNSSTGMIYMKSNTVFDRELKDRYDIKISARDSKFKTESKVIVTIDDVNDCKPKITSINNETIPSDKTKIDITIPFVKLNLLLQKDFLLFGLRATDCDMDGSKNSEIRFQLNSTATNYLKIDQTNGVVKADQRIIQNTNSLSIGLTVLDSPETNPLSSSININLKIINDNNYRESLLVKLPPKTLTVSELVKLNETLYKFETISNNVDIVLVGGDPREYFTIEKNSLKIKKNLDYEKIKDYNLYFEAFKKFKDYKEFQQIKLHLQVINENDLPPKFDYDLYNATILEEVDETILVTQVIATDIDSDGPNSEVIKYKIISPTNAPFRIDENFGKIWTTSKIDREVNSEFNLIILAEDEGGLSSTCKVHITVGKI